MTNREYTAKVDLGLYPDDIVVPLDEPFRNESGSIQNLVLERFTSAAIIHSLAGSMRSNHYHKTDWHYMYVANGEMVYYWRPVGDPRAPKQRRFQAGEMMFTPPMMEHAVFFPAHTTLITFAKNIRSHESHEADLVRTKVIEIVEGQPQICV